MAARKFRFVSPGVFIDEIDQSQLPAGTEAVGPVIIGRTEKGPGMIPVRVGSFSEFVETFGNPIDGKGGVDDVWRETNKSSPTYGAYAAQAYLRANVGPVTFVRLMGTHHSTAGASGQAGWQTSNTPDSTLASNGGAFGLFLWPSASGGSMTLTVDASGVLPSDNRAPWEPGAVWPYFGAPGLHINSSSLGLTAYDGTTYFASASISGSTATSYSASAVSTTAVAQHIAHSLNLARIAGFGIMSGTLPSDNTVTITFESVYNSTTPLTGAGTMISDASASCGTASVGTATGSLAAIYYMDSGVPVLSGNTADGTAVESTAAVVKANSDGNFKVRILASGGGQTKNSTFNMSEASTNFIRNQFNTNPQLTNGSSRGSIEDSTNSTHYWLGETYERYISDNSLTGANIYGTILAVASSSNEYGPHDKTMAYRDAHTGWFFAQNTDASYSTYEYSNMDKLFKFVGINGHGEWLQNNIKISIDNIRASSNDNDPYGTFDVVVRSVSDSDLGQVVLERFSNCSLDRKSMDYVAVKVGDTYRKWDEGEKRYREYGDYPNQSRYIRVVLGSKVSNNALTVGTETLPFGVYGPPRFKSFAFGSGTTTTQAKDSGSYILGDGNIPQVRHRADSKFMYVGSGSASDFGEIKISYPAVATRSTATQDAAGPLTNAYFGLHTGKSNSVTNADPGYGEYLRAMGADVISDSSWADTFGESGYGTGLEEQWIFTLDEIVLTSGSSTFDTSKPTTGISEATWTSGSYKDGTSWNAKNALALGATRYKNILESKCNRFTSPMFGGFDGLDIVERDPFRNTRIDDSTDETANYTYHTIKRAIDTVADPEVLSCNLISVPGITNESITKYLIDTAQGRADCLAIIDVKGGFQPRHESSAAIASRQGSLDSVLTNIKARNLNNSYGCAYYPWVTIRDDINSSFVKAPPSVVAMGVMASTERKADVWFAPAGFNRGGLSQGAGGIAVLSVETKLTSRNRDDLYDVNINPIASFPSEGIVVFGQKTLQSTQSALDRINVRRLLIYAKKGISQIASTTLFQPNVRDTWNAFKGRAENFLGDLKVRYGVDDFKVVLDETTTTPDLVDRNIMYAKIFIKPTRAIEFIAIDFIITRSGASFED